MASERSSWLTPAAHRMLLQMRDGEDKYAISEGISVWVDYERFSTRTLYLLLRLCLISKESFSKETTETWVLNEDGENILKHPDHEPRIIEVQRKELAKRSVRDGD